MGEWIEEGENILEHQEALLKKPICL